MGIAGFIIGLVAGVGFFLAENHYLVVRLVDYLSFSFAVFGFILSLLGIIKKSATAFGFFGIMLCGTIAIISLLALVSE